MESPVCVCRSCFRWMAAGCICRVTHTHGLTQVYIWCAGLTRELARLPDRETMSVSRAGLQHETNRPRAREPKKPIEEQKPDDGDRGMHASSRANITDHRRHHHPASLSSLRGPVLGGERSRRCTMEAVTGTNGQSADRSATLTGGLAAGRGRDWPGAGTRLAWRPTGVDQQIGEVKDTDSRDVVSRVVHLGD
jgi:hypothetical protein